MESSKNSTKLGDSGSEFSRTSSEQKEQNVAKVKEAEGSVLKGNPPSFQSAFELMKDFIDDEPEPEKNEAEFEYGASGGLTPNAGGPLKPLHKSFSEISIKRADQDIYDVIDHQAGYVMEIKNKSICDSVCKFIGRIFAFSPKVIDDKYILFSEEMDRNAVEVRILEAIFGVKSKMTDQDNLETALEKYLVDKLSGKNAAKPSSNAEPVSAKSSAPSIIREDEI